MCGILGTVSSLPLTGPPEFLTLGEVRHCGPYALASVQVGSARLGHARLSISDLAAVAQPMSDVSGLATAVFSGDIYNCLELRDELQTRGQRFATRSDIEVILTAYLTWGVAGFARLSGMFAIALCDHRDGTTVLARDPFGIKPLFWARSADGSLGFASEMEALFTLPGLRPKLDYTSLLDTLMYRQIFGLHTLYAGVQRLKPGMALVIAPRASSVIHVQFSSITEDVERAIAKYSGRAVTTDDVRKRVRISVERHVRNDVPLGCFLSGGLDSSVVASLLARPGGETVNAYSVGFEGGSDLSRAELVARHMGLRLHPVTVGPRDFWELAPQLSGSLNGPFSEPADIAMLKLSQRAAQDVKVVLSGQGGDEVLAGHPKYGAETLSGTLGPALGLGNRWLRRRGRLGIAADALSQPDRTARWMRWFANNDAPDSLVSGLLLAGAYPDRARQWVGDRVARYPADWDDVQRMQVLDLEAWLPNNLLHRSDYTTMQASIKQRYPLLDRELTPWAVALQRQVKVRRMKGETPLRNAFAHALPREVFDRPKSGCRLPLGEWITADPQLSAMTRDLLLSPQAQVRTLMDARQLETLLSPATLAQSSGAKLAWTVLNLELWLQAVRAQGVPA